MLNPVSRYFCLVSRLLHSVPLEYCTANRKRLLLPGIALYTYIPIIMKRVYLLLTGFSCLLFLAHTHAQSETGAAYFAGKWNVDIKGMSGEEMKMIIVLEKKNDKLSGSVQDAKAKGTTKIDNIKLSDRQVTLYFKMNNANTYLVLVKKGEDRAEGNYVDLYGAVAERVRTAN